MGRRQFAKKSEDVRHFRLVARSQNDPRADDPDAPPLVLEPFVPPGATRRTGLSEAELRQVPASLVAGCPVAFADPDAPPRRVAAREAGEEEEFDEEDLDGDCYFPKDGYNYEQHLKRVSGGKGGGVVGVILEAPRKVPPEQLNKQPARTAEEDEVLRALDNAEEYEELEEGELEDLVPVGTAEPEEVLLWGPSALQDAGMPDLAAFKAAHQARLAAAANAAGSGRRVGEGEGELGSDEEGEDEEGEEDEEDEEEEEEEGGLPAGRACAGAAAARSGKGYGGGADAKREAAAFEEFFAAEYGDEDDIGACEEEEIEGPVALENCEEVLDEYLEGRRHEIEKLHSLYEPQEGKLDDVPRVIEETKAIIQKYYLKEDDEESDTSSGEGSHDESRTWDCESVLSTLSNLSNRPGKIGRIKIIKKPTPAMKPVKERPEGAPGSEDEEAVDVVELPDVVTERPRGETAEERKKRKGAVKEMRKICRRMKKESKETFRAEAAKLPGQQGTADVRQRARVFRL